MKNWIMVVILCLFTIGCVSSNAQKGAVLGGLGGMAGSALGKGDRSTTAIIGGVGAVTGYLIGNEMDKANNRQNQHVTPAYNNNNQQTNCRKVTKRTYENGQVVETIEEICEGRKVTDTY